MIIVSKLNPAPSTRHGGSTLQDTVCRAAGAVGAGGQVSRGVCRDRDPIRGAGNSAVHANPFAYKHFPKFLARLNALRKGYFGEIREADKSEGWAK